MEVVQKVRGLHKINRLRHERKTYLLSFKRDVKSLENVGSSSVLLPCVVTAATGRESVRP